jgi:NTE family protein
MTYHFRNLIFEGGGVKGIAYIGAMKVLEDKGILPQIQRVGGTSAGAINATLFALGYTLAEQDEILRKLDFRKFLDDQFGVIRDSGRLLSEFGWYRGDYFHEWVSKLVKRKLGSANATFQDLKEAKQPELYVYGTNLSTRFGEVFSIERTPSERIADAIRISMSIPLFFASVRNARRDVYVDGGLLDNYPVKLFDREKYIDPAARPQMARETDYYKKENKRFLKEHQKSAPYCYNRETLGMRLDSAKEIGVFRYGDEPQREKIDDFFDYAIALVTSLIEAQASQHLHSDDWQRTVYIDTLDVKTTDFGLSDKKKQALLDSGRKGALEYFTWYDDPKSQAANKPA